MSVSFAIEFAESSKHIVILGLSKSNNAKIVQVLCVIHI
jgi:hypothetical protein